MKKSKFPGTGLRFSQSRSRKTFFFLKRKQCKTAKTGAGPHQCSAWSPADRGRVRFPRARLASLFSENLSTVRAPPLPLPLCHCGPLPGGLEDKWHDVGDTGGVIAARSIIRRQGYYRLGKL